MQGQVTAAILNKIRECTENDNNEPMAPNAVADAVHEMSEVVGFSDRQAEELYDAVFALASALVAEPGEYY